MSEPARPGLSPLWSPFEESYLLSHRLDSNADISAALGRTPGAVARKRSVMGISVKPKRRWTEKDMEQLRELAPTHTAREIADLMGRSAKAVRWAAQRTGVQTAKPQNPAAWSPEDDQFLVNHHLDMTMDELVAGLGRTPYAIEKRAELLHCLPTPPRNGRGKKLLRWKGEHDDYLVSHYHHESDADIAKATGHTKASVKVRRRELGLNKRPGRPLGK